MLPDTNTIKVNCDAALFEASQTYSFSVVALDHAGGLIASCKQGVIAPEVAEAISIMEVLSWIKAKGWKQSGGGIRLSHGCADERSSTVMFSYFGRIIEECRMTWRGLKDSNVTLRFVKRYANQVAPCLARSTCSLADHVWRVDNIHSQFYDVLVKDLVN